MRVQPPLALLGLLGLACSSAVAQSATAQAVASAQTAASSCVEISVNDRPALSYACLNQRLASATQAAPAPNIALDPVTRAPPNQQVGQFNFSAFSHQMGTSLGKSVTPQRPAPAPAPPLLGVPRGAH